MRGVTLNPEFGKHEMEKILNTYNNFVGPVIRKADVILDKYKADYYKAKEIDKINKQFDTDTAEIGEK